MLLGKPTGERKPALVQQLYSFAQANCVHANDWGRRMNRYLIAGIAAAALAIPAFAIAQMHEGDMTRAQAEAKVLERFATLDLDKDGFVAANEMRPGGEAMRPESNDEHFARMDTDKDGSISRSEFDAAHKGAPRDHGMTGRHGGGHGKGMARVAMFRMADTDRDGRVSQKEAVDGALRLFDKADTDRNGTVTAEERRTARQAMRAMWRARTEG